MKNELLVADDLSLIQKAEGKLMYAFSRRP